MSSRDKYEILNKIMLLIFGADLAVNDYLEKVASICVEKGGCSAFSVHLAKNVSNFIVFKNVESSEIEYLNSIQYQQQIEAYYCDPDIVTEERTVGAFTLQIFPIKSKYMVYGLFFVYAHPDLMAADDFTSFFQSIAFCSAGYLERLLLKEDLSVGMSEKLKNNELNRVLDAIKEPVFYKDRSNRYIGCNRAFLDFTNSSYDEVIGSTAHDLFPDNQADRHTGNDAKVIDLGKNQIYEARYLTPDGETCTMLVSKNPIYNDDLDIIGSVGVVKDITELKQIQQQYEDKNAALMKINSALLGTQKEILDINKRLATSEENYRLLIENQREFIVKLDLTGQFIYISQSFREFASIKVDKKVHFLQDLLLGADRLRLDALLRQLSLQENENELEFRIRIENSFRWLAWSFKSVFTGRNLEFIIGVGRDITARKKTEAELENYRSLLEAAFTQSPNPIMLIKYPDKTIMMINEAAQRFLDLANDSYEERAVEDVEFPQTIYFDENEVNLRNLLQSEKLYYEVYSNVEIRYPDSKGNDRYSLLYSTPIHNNIGELISYLLIFPEISSLKKAEKRLEQQTKEIQKMQKLESIGVLAGGIAHDFNNILSAVMGNLSLARFYGADERIVTLLTKAENAIGRAKELTNQLLTFSKGGAPVKRSTSLNDIVRESALFSLHGSKSVIEFNLDTECKPGLIDSGQISQVIQNLVINASQAMASGGKIIISTTNCEVKDSELPLEIGEYVKVSVSDSGGGVDQEIQDRIFDPFFSTKSDGNGLGLATSYNIIKKHNGYISFDSDENGSSFFIYLPVSGEVLFKPMTSFNHQDKFSGRVLLMDDDQDVLDVGKNLLKLIGFEVDVVTDGEQLLSLVTSKRDQGESYDLYVMDLTVPGGMGGQETIAELLKSESDALVIVSSGYSNNEVLSEYKKFGFSGVLEKPYNISDVKHVLKEINYANKTN